MPMNVSKEQIIDALIGEHYHYLAECPDEEGEMSIEDYTAYIKGLTYEELVEETSTDEIFTIEEFVSIYN